MTCTAFILSLSIAASPQVLHATRAAKVATLTACDAATAACVTRFTDASSPIKLLPRGGESDLANVVQSVGARVWAVGTSKTSRSGAIYEVSVDGTHTLRKVADVESRSPVERIAVDARGQRVAYPAQSEDKSFRGEGSNYKVNAIVIHDLATGQVVQRVDARKAVGKELIADLAFAPDGGLLVRVEAMDAHEGLYKVDAQGNFQKLGIKLTVVDHVVAYLEDGTFLVSSMLGKTLRVMDAGGKVLRELPRDHGMTLWTRLSPDGGQVAFQEKDELWVRDLKAEKDSRVFAGKGGFTLVGWLGNP